MKDAMLFLADYYVTGIIICSVIVVIGYIVFSVLLVRSARKIGYDVGISGMIPFINLYIWIKKKLIVRRIKKEEKLKLLEDTRVVQEEEVALW